MLTRTDSSCETAKSVYYVKSFDIDGEFVREIGIRASSLEDAMMLAVLEFTSEEISTEAPLG